MRTIRFKNRRKTPKEERVRTMMTTFWEIKLRRSSNRKELIKL
jgi:hypothetical protein